MSAATDSSFGHPPTKTTSTESSPVIWLLEESLAGKLLDVLSSAIGSSLASIDLGEISSLTAGGCYLERLTLRSRRIYLQLP